MALAGLLAMGAACSGGKGGKDDPVDPCTSITQEQLDDSNVCTRDYCSDGMVKHDAQAYSTQRNCADPLNYCDGSDRVTTPASVTDACGAGVRQQRC